VGFCPYRESNPASSDSQPSHYTDYTIPASGQTRNAYRIVEDIIKKELRNGGYEYELDLLSRGELSLTPVMKVNVSRRWELS